MSKAEKTDKTATENNLSKNIFAETNRGMLLDIVVFLLNLFLMRYLAQLFVETFRAASGDDEIAQLTLFLFFLAIFILPPLGATLKRWHYHHRLRLQGKTADNSEAVAGGCLFNPIFFFCLNVVIFAAINAFVSQFLYGDDKPGGTYFISSIFFGLILVVLQTIVVYRYFSPPKNAPAVAFLCSPRAEIFGDACIFLNMILFQVIWNLIAMIPFQKVSGASDFAGRIFFLGFVSLLIYFPPRIFYLAEDIKRRRVWLTILLANVPTILRVLIGTNSNTNW